MLRLARELGEWDLMCSKSPFDLFPIDDLWSSPTLWCAQDDHGPARNLLDSVLSCFCLNRLDLLQDGIKRGSHLLMHHVGLIAFNEIRVVTVTSQQAREV